MHNKAVETPPVQTVVQTLFSSGLSFSFFWPVYCVFSLQPWGIEWRSVQCAGTVAAALILKKRKEKKEKNMQVWDGFNSQPPGAWWMRGSFVIITPLQIFSWLSPVTSASSGRNWAAQTIKESTVSSPWVLVLVVMVPAGMWHRKYNSIYFPSSGTVTQDSVLLALKSWLPWKEEKGEKKLSPGLQLKWIFN